MKFFLIGVLHLQNSVLAVALPLDGVGGFGHVRNNKRAALLHHLAHTAVEELGGTGSFLHKGNPAHTFED